MNVILVNFIQVYMLLNLFIIINFLCFLYYLLLCIVHFTHFSCWLIEAFLCNMISDNVCHKYIQEIDFRLIIYLSKHNFNIFFDSLSKLCLKCTYCAHCSTTFDTFWNVPRPIPERTGRVSQMATKNKIVQNAKRRGHV